MRILITADDYGLTRGATDAILEAADTKALSNVSILANGEAADYALEEYKKRQNKLNLSLHLNLTEGKAISDPSVLPLLTDREGNFKRSALGLLTAYFFSMPQTRTRFRDEVRTELLAQLGKIEEKAPVRRIDGHQHVHMIPFIFDIAMGMRDERSIRITREPLYAASAVEFLRLFSRLPAWCILMLFAERNCRKYFAHRRVYFLGFLFSGRMRESTVRTGFRRAYGKKAEEVEIALHPGGARPEEFKKWKGGRADYSWYDSPWRVRELILLKENGVNRTIDLIKNEKALPSEGYKKIFRYIVSGTISTSTNLGLLYLLTEVFGIWYLYSACASYVLSIGVSFSLQKFWTFQDHSTDRLHVQLPAYTGIQLIGLVFDEIGLYLLVSFAGLWYMAAQFILLAMVAIWNYILFNFFIFKRAKSSSWNEFWNQPNSVYISERYKNLHYSQLQDRMLSCLSPSRPCRFLDYGAGYGKAAPALAANGIEVYLYDPAPLMQEHLKRLENDYIHFIKDPPSLTQKMDIIFIFSVFQYLSRQEAKHLLRLCKEKLADNGKLYLGDIVDNEHSGIVRDTLSLLKTSWRFKFFPDALVSLVKTFFSDYRTIREKRGFSAYSRKEFATLLREEGFEAVEVPNIPLSPDRYMFCASKILS